MKNLKELLLRKIKEKEEKLILNTRKCIKDYKKEFDTSKLDSKIRKIQLKNKKAILRVDKLRKKLNINNLLEEINKIKQDLKEKTNKIDLIKEQQDLIYKEEFDKLRNKINNIN